MGAVLHIENGCLISNYSGYQIVEPSICIDTESDTLMTWGSADEVNKKYNNIINRCAEKHIDSLCSGLCCINLSETSLSLEQQAYIIRRCVEYTASGFCKTLCKKVAEPDCIDWLRSEMQRVPLEV